MVELKSNLFFEDEIFCFGMNPLLLEKDIDKISEKLLSMT